jgi:hypothetical protein
MMRNTASPIVEKTEILKTIRAAEALVTETIARTIDVIGIGNLAGTIETGIITGVTIVIGSLAIVMTETGITLELKEANVQIVDLVAIVLIVLTTAAIKIAETTTVTAEDLPAIPEDAAAEKDALDLDPMVNPPREKEMKASARKSRDKPLKKEEP